MIWVRRALLAAIVIALLVFGAVADRALVQQAAYAADAARSDLDEKARLTGLSVRAALVRLEQSILAGAALPGVITCRRPAGTGIGTSGSQPYAKRDRGELVSLLDHLKKLIAERGEAAVLF